MNAGFGISDFIQVSNLAFKLYRKCRDFPENFAVVSSEVANLRLVVDDIRMTIKENDPSLDQDDTDSLLQLGQGCQDCLLELESLLGKYQSLGTRVRRSWGRIAWEETKVSSIRQRIIANTNMLSSFNLRLVRSSTSRIETLLRGLVEDIKSGRHEGSIISVQTIKSVQDGDEDAWNEIRSELEDSGVTEDEINENKQFITEYIIRTIQDHRAELVSIDAASFVTAAEGTGSLLSGQTLTADRANVYDFPGAEYRATKDLVHSVDHLYREAPDDFREIKDALRDILNSCREVEYSAGDTGSLYYHERLSRKNRMIPILYDLNQSLKYLQSDVEHLQERSSDSNDVVTWNKHSPSFLDALHAAENLTTHTYALTSLFKDLGTLVLCNLDDRIKQILSEAKERQRSSSILYEWDELEAELIDDESISAEDVEQHKGAILSFMNHLVEEKEAAERINNAVSSSGDTLEISSHSKSPLQTSPIARKSEGSTSEMAQSASSLSGSLPELSWKALGSPIKPKRISVLFVDWDNTVRSPMTQCYLEHLMAIHPQLTHHFSRVLSAGLSASKPGVQLPPGVDYMLRDYGVSHNFKHTSRRLEKRDVEKMEFVLGMNSSHVQEILHTWPPTSENEESTESIKSPSESNPPPTRENVRLLGGFGGYGDREVTIPEAIDHAHWFQVGTRRIYPGYDRPFSDIKKFVADFVLEMTGYDINSQAAASGDEYDSREVSQNISEDEDYANALRSSMHDPWDHESVPSPFEELSQTVSQFQIGGAWTGNPFEQEQRLPGPDSPLSVMIRAEYQHAETDEELLHKYHEQFDKITKLLLTDIGDNSVHSLRNMILEWQDDNNRALLTVSTGRVKWVLQKHFGEGAEGCSLCQAEDKRPGLVLNHNLEVISRTHAGVIADYLHLAIQQSQHESSAEEATQLERIRDNPIGKKTAPPSIKDDVSVSVRNDRPLLAHDIAAIRRKDAQSKLAGVNSSSSATDVVEDGLGRTPLPRRKTQDGTFADDSYKIVQHRAREASDATIKAPTPPPAMSLKTIEQKILNPPKEKQSVPAVTRPPVSILFLSAFHMHLAVMAEVYLLFLVDRNLGLSTRICDVVSAGCKKITPEQRFNPKKLERLFKSHNMYDCWTRKPERLLLPEDTADFNYILTIDSADHSSPYTCWADENPEEYSDLTAKCSATDPDAWKSNFKSKIIELYRYFPRAPGQAKILMDPVQPGEKNALGIRHAKFEEAYGQVKRAIDRFLLLELRYSVEERKFIRNGKGQG